MRPAIPPGACGAVGRAGAGAGRTCAGGDTLVGSPGGGAGGEGARAGALGRSHVHPLSTYPTHSRARALQQRLQAV